MKRKLLIGLAAIAVVSIFTGSSNEKLCTTYSIALNKVSPFYDGSWQGITAASDGACYFGTASHKLTHGGGFFRFDPKTKNFEVLTSDLSDLVGETFDKNTPQGKCHSPIIEINGTLYLSTHLAAYWSDSVLNRYPGSHIMSYTMATKKWRDYGIVKPRFSTYSAVQVDVKRGKIYAMIVPFAPEDKKKDGNHLYEIDIKSGAKRDLGRLSDGMGLFWFYLDDTGKLWMPIWKGSNKLHCYDPETGKITTYDNAFPEAKLAPDGVPVDTCSFKSPAWTWAQAIDGGKRCLFTLGDLGGGDERLWIFDPSKNIKTKEAFIPVCYIGSTFLSVALGGDRVYFIQRADYKSQRNHINEYFRDLPHDASGYEINNLHLKSVALNQKGPLPFIDHGRIIDQDGRTPGDISSLAADDKGNVFLNGSWGIKPGDQPTLSLDYGAKKGENDYKSLTRGEFFSWVNVSDDLK